MQTHNLKENNSTKTVIWGYRVLDVHNVGVRFTFLYCYGVLDVHNVSVRFTSLYCIIIACN